MSTPTLADQALIRSRPQASKLYLSIYQPTVVFSCVINEPGIIPGSRTFGYVSGSGDPAKVLDGMICLVGSVAGGDNIGKVRVRSISGGIITVEENRHIAWVDGLYFTVLNFVEIRSVYPRIITDPANASNTLWYKDWDIPYSGQNSTLGTFVNMGSNVAAFREGGTGTVYYSASGTYNVNGEALTYQWNFEGGTPTGSAVNTPGYVAYTTPGHYKTTLEVTNASGGVDKSYRFVSIYDRPGAGSNPPILQWQFKSPPSGARDNGGYTASIIIPFASVPESTIRDGAAVIIFTDDWYDTTKKSIGGNQLNRSNIFFTGYILKDTIEYDYNLKQVNFDIGGPSEVLKTCPMFSVETNFSNDPTADATNANTPSGWVLVKTMTVKKALYSYLRWHSTLLKCTDVEVRIPTDYQFQYFSTDRNSIYDALQSFMKNSLYGNVTSDIQGKLWLEVEAGGIDQAASVLPVGMEITKSDWIGTPSIEEVHNNKISQLELGGVAFDPTSGTGTAYLSQAPGETPSYRGNTMTQQGLILASQAQLNTLTADVWANINSRYPDSAFLMAGNYRNLDIAPQEQTPISIGLFETNRGIIFVRKPHVPRVINWQYDPSTMFLNPMVRFAEVTDGTLSETLTIPTDPPTNWEYDPPVVDYPPVTPPTPPTPPVIDPSDPASAFCIGWKYTGSAVDGDTDTSTPNPVIWTMARTANFNSATPNWTECWPTNIMITGTFYDFKRDYNNLNTAGYYLTSYALYYFSNLNTTPTATLLLTIPTVVASAGYTYTPGECYLRAFSITPADTTIGFLVASSRVPSYADIIVKITNLPSATWSVVGVADGNINDLDYAIHISKNNAQVVYFGGKFNVLGIGTPASVMMKSVDQGVTWQRISVPIPSGGTRQTPYAAGDILIPGTNDDVVLYMGWDEQYYGGNNESWVARTADAFTVNVTGTFVSPSFSGPFMIETGTVGTYSMGMGSWQQNRRECMMVSPTSSPTTILLLAKAGLPTTHRDAPHLFISNDSGATWTHKYDFRGYVRKLVVHPGNANTLYLGGNQPGFGYPIPSGFDGSILVSHDQGTTWTDKIGDWKTVFKCSPNRGGCLSGDEAYNEWGCHIIPLF